MGVCLNESLTPNRVVTDIILAQAAVQCGIRTSAGIIDAQRIISFGFPGSGPIIVTGRHIRGVTSQWTFRRPPRAAPLVQVRVKMPLGAPPGVSCSCTSAALRLRCSSMWTSALLFTLRWRMRPPHRGRCLEDLGGSAASSHHILSCREISFIHRTDAPVKHNPISASSAPIPRRRYRSMTVVSKENPSGSDPLKRR